MLRWPWSVKNGHRSLFFFPLSAVVHSVTKNEWFVCSAKDYSCQPKIWPKLRGFAFPSFYSSWFQSLLLSSTDLIPAKSHSENLPIEFCWRVSHFLLFTFLISCLDPELNWKKPEFQMLPSIRGATASASHPRGCTESVRTATLRMPR